MEKNGFWRIEALMSLKRGNIGPRFLLQINRKSHMHFRLVSKSTTLHDLEGSLIMQSVSKRAQCCCYLFIF